MLLCLLHQDCTKTYRTLNLSRIIPLSSSIAVTCPTIKWGQLLICLFVTPETLRIAAFSTLLNVSIDWIWACMVFMCLWFLIKLLLQIKNTVSGSKKHEIKLMAWCCSTINFACIALHSWLLNIATNDQTVLTKLIKWAVGIPWGNPWGSPILIVMS